MTLTVRPAVNFRFAILAALLSCAGYAQAPVTLPSVVGVWQFAKNSVWVQIDENGSAYQCRIGKGGTVFSSRGAFVAPGSIEWRAIWSVDKISLRSESMLLTGRYGEFEFHRITKPIDAACLPADERNRPPDVSAATQGLPVAVPTITPVFHQLVVFTLPAHFRIGGDRTNGTFYIREHIPGGESPQSWTKMITLTGAKDLARNPAVNLSDYVGRIAAGYEKHCPTTYAVNQLGAQVIDGRDAFAAIASCGSVADGGNSHSETAIIIGVKGAADYYTLQWAERGPVSDKPLSPETTYWSERIAELYPFRLCPIVPGERAPYPSCTKK